MTSTHSVIRLGGYAQNTGKFASSWQDTRRGWEMCVKKANEMGGILVDGVKRPVELYVRNDPSGSTLSTNVPAMLDPSDSKYMNLDFIVGPYSSGANVVAAKAALFSPQNRGHKIFMSHGASESIYYPNNNNTWAFSCMSPAGSYFYNGLVYMHKRIIEDQTDPDHLALKAGTKKPRILFVSTTDAFGASVCAGSFKHAKDLNWDIVYKNLTTNSFDVYIFNYIDGQNTDFTPVIKLAKNFRPHVLTVCG